MEYRIAQQDDLINIAKVHIACFPEYLTTAFGVKLLAEYYGEFLRETELFVVAEDRGNIIGFCVGYLRKTTQARELFIRKNWFALSMRLVGQAILMNKVVICKVFSKIIGLLRPSKSEITVEADGDLLSICSLSEYRGSGVAKDMVEVFEDLLRKNGVKDYLLSVYKYNNRGINFYQKCGMSICAENEEEYKFFKRL